MSKARKTAAPTAPSLVDGAGNAIALGAEIGRGGEGAVFATADEGVVAKLYADPGKARADKLAAMLPMAPRMEAFAAWPRDVLKDAATGRVVGFTMRRASGRNDIHDLFNVKSRRTHFPKADWRFLVHVAANVCRTFGAVHAAGCVVGDVNQGGIRVAEDGTVTLIDCDSVQVSDQNKTFRCEVGVDTHTPPELQGVAFSAVDRTRDHDGFGLAVILFQTLFLGRHPFIGVFSGRGDMDPARAVREHRYAFGTDAARFQMRPPPGSVSPTVAGPEIAALFERAFAPDAARTGRPTAREWLDALVRLEASLARCKADEAHWHAEGQECPWCRLERGSGVQLFPVVVRRLANSLFDMAGFRKALADIPHPGPLPDVEVPRPLPAKRAGLKRKAIHAGTVAVCLALAIAAYGSWSGSLLTLAIVAYPLLRLLARRRPAVRASAGDVKRAERAYTEALEEWKRRAGATGFEERIVMLRAKCREWEALPTEHAQRMRRLTSNLEVDQRARFLDRFAIADAKIEGIGPIRVQSLESFGISTAADIEEDAVTNVPGFGPKRYEQLAAWRKSLERGFTYDPKRGPDPADIARVEAETLQRRRAVEHELATGLAELKAFTRRIEAARRDLLPELQARAVAYLQAEADHEAV